MLIIYSHRFLLIFETKMTRRNFVRILDVITPPYSTKCYRRQIEYDENIQNSVLYSMIKAINIRFLIHYFCFLLLVYLLYEIVLHFKRYVKQATHCKKILFCNKFLA